jgi:hypothetical protein
MAPQVTAGPLPLDLQVGQPVERTEAMSGVLRAKHEGFVTDRGRERQ